MKPVDIGNQDCKKILAWLDAYLSSQLTIETSTEVFRHLERCPQCVAVFRIRERIKRQLSSAVSRDDVSPELKHRVSRMIHKAGGSWIRGL